ncbi:MAG TPA: FAD/NAD(P)-binding oxidoreductase [Solirubrobacteraceae bacterium]|nr:FAD/NAD(P)-binding oxidoreductase [Solirubrobacteraceae bacterium]
MSASRQRVVILGSSFAGLTAAFELRRLLGHRHEIVVLDPRDHFTFIPSLIWLPFGLRDPEDVTFPLAPVYARKGIRFINEAAARLDPDARTVTTASGEELVYDRLFIGTGPRLAFERVAGLGPLDGYTQSVCNLEHALLARAAWRRFLENPGPVVVGTAQGGSCFGASYEFLLNLNHQIERAGLKDRAPVTFISAEPYLGHFGLGGVGSSRAMITRFLERKGIEGITNAVIKEVRPGEIELESGRTLPFAYSMIVPPFAGVDVIRETEGLANPMGWIPVDDRYRHAEREDIYAAGVAIAITPPVPTPVPSGVPKTGQMTEAMAKAAARNIAADLSEGAGERLPLDELSAICILDAGNSGVIFRASNILATGEDGETTARAQAVVGPAAHLAKLAFERVYVGSRRRGLQVL